MRKLIVGAVATASLVGGAVGIAVVSPLGLAGAQDTPGTTPPTTAAPGPAPSTDPAHPGPRGPHGPGMPGRKGDGADPLSQTLKDLVANGTITQAQADAIMSNLKDRMKKDGPGRGGPGDLFGRFGETAAAAIGIDVQTLRQELKGGKSLADVAKAHGVDPQKVIDALVAKATADIDKAVADGKMPADKAAEAKAKLNERITAMVNGQFKGPGGPRGPHGPHGPMPDDGANPPDQQQPPAPTDPAPAPPASSAPTTAAPTTTNAPSTPAPTTAAPSTTSSTAPTAGSTPR